MFDTDAVRPDCGAARTMDAPAQKQETPKKTTVVARCPKNSVGMSCSVIRHNAIESKDGASAATSTTRYRSERAAVFGVLISSWRA
jgi:hypothetical protein